MLYLFAIALYTGVSRAIHSEWLWLMNLIERKPQLLRVIIIMYRYIHSDHVEVHADSPEEGETRSKRINVNTSCNTCTHTHTNTHIKYI